jgi:hypothetical protein
MGLLSHQKAGMTAPCFADHFKGTSGKLLDSPNNFGLSFAAIMGSSEVGRTGTPE